MFCSRVRGFLGWFVVASSVLRVLVLVRAASAVACCAIRFDFQAINQAAHFMVLVNGREIICWVAALLCWCLVRVLLIVVLFCVSFLRPLPLLLLLLALVWFTPELFDAGCVVAQGCF